MSKYDAFTTYDLPIVYKTLEFFPARMIDYYHFMTAANVLILDKNSIPNVEIITMSYLKYIFHASNDENFLMSFLDRLLHIVLMLPEDEKIGYLLDAKKKPIIRIGEDIFDENDFKEMREIIIEQNLLSPPNDKIEKGLRDSMDKARALRQKQNGTKTASLEDQMIAVSIATSLSLDTIYEMTIRKFMKTLERADHKLHYEIFLSASVSGMVTFKDKSVLKHWLAKLEKDDFEGMMSYDAFEGKINTANV